MTYKKSISACPHDCPSTCVLEVSHTNTNIYQVRGSKENSYTSGVVCAKVSRYRERTHHKNRLLSPLQRVGDRGLNSFKKISWNDALDIIAEKFHLASQNKSPESIWPYYYAGTMGLVQRDSINKLRHIMKYSRQHSTICNTLPQTGWMAGVGKLQGPDPREIRYSDLVIVWGGNPASTQVNVMKHIQKARKNNNAKLIVIDPYATRTAKISDMHFPIKPGTDAALACGLLHIMFRDKYADLEYLKKFSDNYKGLKIHLKKKTPEWAAKITGIDKEKIESLAKLIGKFKKTYYRLGYGFARQRNGSINMHAVVCLAVVCGNFRYKGGGAFYNNGDIYNRDKNLIEGLDELDESIRLLDQSRIGSILTNDKNALKNGEEVTALLIQNTNPLVVAPETNLVRKGFSRNDLFICVHEQFMTETAKYSDILLPATTFVEHNDIYQSGGHQHITFAPKLIKPLGESWSNFKLINSLLKRLGKSTNSTLLSETEIINKTLINSNLGNLKDLRKKKWIDMQPSFEESHFLNGFGHKNKKFHFSPKWKNLGPDHKSMPKFPDHVNLNENTNKLCPFKLVTAPAHNFLNSSFTETESSIKKEIKPKLKIHPKDLEELKMNDNQLVRIGNKRGEVYIHLESFRGMQQGVVVAEGIWPNEKFVKGKGINTLVGSDPAPPSGGAAFHDVSIWIKSL